MKKWQKQKGRKKAMRSGGKKDRFGGMPLKLAFVLIIGYALGYLVPVWVSVLISLVIVAYVPSANIELQRKFRS